MLFSVNHKLGDKHKKRDFELEVNLYINPRGKLLAVLVEEMWCLAQKSHLSSLFVLLVL